MTWPTVVDQLGVGVPGAPRLLTRHLRLSWRYQDALYRFDRGFTNLELTGLDRFHAIMDAVEAQAVADDELPPFIGARR